MISIEELIEQPTSDEVLAKMIAALDATGLPASSWRKGGVYRTILRIVATLWGAFLGTLALLIRGFFLETSTGSWLTLLAYYVYGVTRIEATFATGYVTINNTGGGVYAFNAHEVRFKNTTTGAIYENTGTISIGAGGGAGDTVTDIPIQAVEIGTDSNATPGQVDDFETAYSGLAVTNPLAVVGNDAESDPDLRQRCKDYLGVLGAKGPRGAYAYAIKSAVRGDGSPVDVNRWSIRPDPTTGTIAIAIASPSGAPSAADVAYVEDSIENLARPDTDTVTVSAATPLVVNRSLTVYARRTDGVDAAAIEAAIDAALLEITSDYPVGGYPLPPTLNYYFFASELHGQVQGAHRSIYAVEGTGADVLMSADEVVTLTYTLSIIISEVQ